MVLVKVRVSFTVEVDAAAWIEEYGCERSQVREDVRLYIEQAFLAQLDELGLSGRAAS